MVKNIFFHRCQKPQMEYARQLLQSWTSSAKHTMHQFLVETLHRCSSLGILGVVRGQIMTMEMQRETEYPQPTLSDLQQLIEEYDEINDVAIFNDLQRSIAITQDDPGVGIRLAREVKDAIQRIRYKDALGGRIILLANMLHMYHLDIIEQHRVWASTPPLDPDTDRVLTLAIRSLESDADPAEFWSQLPPDDHARLAAYLRVSAEDVQTTMTAYLTAAKNSLFVEQ